jgi:hypothetical protein
VLAVRSAGASITALARGLSREKLVEFVDAVDDAKIAFLHH